MPKAKPAPEQIEPAAAAAPPVVTMPNRFATHPGAMVPYKTPANEPQPRNGHHVSPEQFAQFNRRHPNPKETAPVGMLPPAFVGESPYPQVPDYHPDKPKGHRCAWSWAWATKRFGCVTPDMAKPLNTMTPLEKFLELLDYFERATIMENVQAGAALETCDPETGRSSRPDLVNQMLQRCRARVSETLAHHDMPPPERIRLRRYRKGWPGAETASPGNVLNV